MRQLTCELYKQRTTRTSLTIVLCMLALIAAAVALHFVTLPARTFGDAEGQLRNFGLGTTFGMLFASLHGAMSVAGEMRTGLIRPTLLAMPRRSRVLLAKAAACALTGFAMGVLAVSAALAVGAIALAARGIEVAPGAAELVQLVLGGGAAAACWAVIGVGIGAIARSPVVAVVGLVVWQLFIEQTLIASLPDAARYAPGSSAGSLAGAILQQTSSWLLAPAVGAATIVAWVVATIAAGLVVMERRDVG